jgi:hypothetical protein
VARTNAWLEPWFLNAKLAYHRSVVRQLESKLMEAVLATLTVLVAEHEKIQALEARLKEVSRG